MAYGNWLKFIFPSISIGEMCTITLAHWRLVSWILHFQPFAYEPGRGSTFTKPVLLFDIMTRPFLLGDFSPSARRSKVIWTQKEGLSPFEWSAVYIVDRTQIDAIRLIVNEWDLNSLSLNRRVYLLPIFGRKFSSATTFHQVFKKFYQWFGNCASCCNLIRSRPMHNHETKWSKKQEKTRLARRWNGTPSYQSSPGTT